MRHLLEIDDLSAQEVLDVLNRGLAATTARPLAGRTMALLFEKPSARTRNSMEAAVVQLGGHPTYITGDEVGMDRRESTEDVGRTLASYHAAVGARVFAHSTVERLASLDLVPVVNLLSDAAHPMQALADLLTLADEFGGPDALAGRTVAYVGDANNVCRSLGLALGLVGAKLAIAAPEGYRFGDADLARLAASGCEPMVTGDPTEAVAGADAVYTDVWTSMGQEAEREQRLRDFDGFTVDAALADRMAPHGVVLHCLPAHRGEEIAADALDGPRSRVWRQARHRMTAARGLLEWILEQA